jgi:hypothetical protein
MNAAFITTITTVAAAFAALWTIMANFDKRNADRFDALQKQAESSKEVLRAEMREMRAEIRLEIKEAADRRVMGR